MDDLDAVVAGLLVVGGGDFVGGQETSVDEGVEDPVGRVARFAPDGRCRNRRIEAAGLCAGRFNENTDNSSSRSLAPLSPVP